MKANGQNRNVKSANIHVCGFCNYRCEHCFASTLSREYISPGEWQPVLEHLRSIGITKVNIAGGEPLLYPHLVELCTMIRDMRFTVSIVSNGSRFDEEMAQKLSGIVSWMGFSVDSPDEEDEILIGRHEHGMNHIENLVRAAGLAHSHGMKVKLNITVLRRSWNKDFAKLIEAVDPQRIKAFRALTVEGANTHTEDTWSITDEQYAEFKRNHEGIDIVYEDNEDMVGTYLMFDPLGRWMVNNGAVLRFLPIEHLFEDGVSAEVDIDRYYGRKAYYGWDE